MEKVILASASPRRIMLLKNLGLDFISIPADIDESILPEEHPMEAVKRIAAIKAEAVARGNINALVIAADTIVVYKEQILGKPVDEDDAFAKLSLLSGQEHQVITGICVINTAAGTWEAEETITQVHFRAISPAEIRAYIASGEPMDKAGAYGIQGRASLLIDRIEGCYFNVVGLPLSCLYQMLKRQGLDLLGEWSK